MEEISDSLANTYITRPCPPTQAKMPASIYAIVHSRGVLTTAECKEITNTEGQPLFKSLIANYHYTDRATGMTFQTVHFDPPLSCEAVKVAFETKLNTPLTIIVRMSANAGLNRDYDTFEDQKNRTSIRHTLFMNRYSPTYGSFMAHNLEIDLYGCRNPDYIPSGKEKKEGFYTGSDATLPLEDE